MQKWQMQDPAKVAEILERAEIRRDRDMGRGLKEVPVHMQKDLFQWGNWVNRPQYWTNLGITPFCKLVGLSVGGSVPGIRLDPQNLAIHKAVMRLDDSHKMVLYAYYVASIRHEDKPSVFNGHGISRRTYYRRLTAGSIRAHNSAMRWLESAKRNK